MAQEHTRLPEEEADRIYSRRIRPDFLNDIPESASPRAVLVGGQPGSGKSFILAQIRARMSGTEGPSATISGEELREYHPYLWSRTRIDAQVTQHTQADAGEWYARLANDGIAKRANLILETSMRQPASVVKLGERLRGAGYEVTAVVLAVEKDTSRQASLTRYDVARSVGEVPRFVPGSYHDGAYDRLRATVAQLETERAVDGIELIARDGRALYNNQVDRGEWVRPPKAVTTLDDFRNRRRPARELADSALRWQTLAQRLGSDPSIPREVAAQAVAWRNEATQKAEQDPDARLLLKWGREAEAFRTMDLHRFVREFPQHTRMAERLEQAVDYAQTNFSHPVDRERFVRQARERIAERIGEGRSAAPEKTSERAPPGRTR